MDMNITFQGEPVTLVGKPIQVGEKLPDVTLFDRNLKSVRLHDLPGCKVLAVVPSLDTGVCDLEIKTFQQKARTLGNVQVYAISVDLPFAQARWCAASGVDAVIPLSDYNNRAFGLGTGTLLEEIALLTRAVFVVDEQQVVRYVEYVPEITQPPNYEAIWTSLSSLGC